MDPSDKWNGARGTSAIVARSDGSAGGEVLISTMPTYSSGAIAELVSALGHGGGEIRMNRRRTAWVFVCGCGFHSESRMVQEMAKEQGVRHLRAVAANALREAPGHDPLAIVRELQRRAVQSA